MFDWEDFSSVSELEFKIIQSEDEKYNRTMGSSRGPIDVHMAEDFSKFMEICQAQQDDESDEN
jgi:hypothetical protein